MCEGWAVIKPNERETVRRRIIQIIVVTMLAGCIADAPSMAPATLEDPTTAAVSSNTQSPRAMLPQSALVAVVDKVLAQHPAARTAPRTLVATVGTDHPSATLTVGERSLSRIRHLGGVRFENARAGDYIVSVDSYQTDGRGGSARARMQHYTPDGKRFWGHFYDVDLVRASDGTWSASTIRGTDQFSGGIERPTGWC